MAFDQIQNRLNNNDKYIQMCKLHVCVGEEGSNQQLHIEGYVKLNNDNSLISFSTTTDFSNIAFVIEEDDDKFIIIKDDRGYDIDSLVGKVCEITLIGTPFTITENPQAKLKKEVLKF